jgi:hypothetical protein
VNTHKKTIRQTPNEPQATIEDLSDLLTPPEPKPHVQSDADIQALAEFENDLRLDRIATIKANTQKLIRTIVDEEQRQIQKINLEKQHKIKTEFMDAMFLLQTITRENNERKEFNDRLKFEYEDFLNSPDADKAKDRKKYELEMNKKRKLIVNREPVLNLYAYNPHLEEILASLVGSKAKQTIRRDKKFGTARSANDYISARSNAIKEKNIARHAQGKKLLADPWGDMRVVEEDLDDDGNVELTVRGKNDLLRHVNGYYTGDRNDDLYELEHEYFDRHPSTASRKAQSSSAWLRDIRRGAKQESFQDC